MGFDDDLDLGVSYEKRAVDYFDHTEYEHKTGYFKDYDLIFDNNIKVEVKIDRLGMNTGNLCIEYMYNNIESGISSTKSDYYLYFMVGANNEYIYKIPTDKIREAILNNNFRSIDCGDGRKSKCYLINREIFKDYLL